MREVACDDGALAARRDQEAGVARRVSRRGVGRDLVGQRLLAGE